MIGAIWDVIFILSLVVIALAVIGVSWAQHEMKHHHTIHYH